MWCLTSVVDDPRASFMMVNFKVNNYAFKWELVCKFDVAENFLLIVLVFIYIFYVNHPMFFKYFSSDCLLYTKYSEMSRGNVIFHRRRLFLITVLRMIVLIFRNIFQIVWKYLIPAASNKCRWLIIFIFITDDTTERALISSALFLFPRSCIVPFAYEKSLPF